MQKLSATPRLRMKQMQPGIWVGRRARIAPSAKLLGPCWIGDNAKIGPDVTIGPMAFLEDEVVADEACEIINSWVGPETFVGKLIRIEDSLAWGSDLINWKKSSYLHVPDAFLMCSRARARRKPRALSPRRLATLFQDRFSKPLEVVLGMKEKLQG